jgi:uncharacterized protein
MWQGLVSPSLERLIVTELPNGFELSSLILLAQDELASVVRYRILVDQNWLTKSVTVEVDGSGRDPLTLRRNTTGQWQRNGETAADLAGLTDVDLEWSPSTNSLPIRRLRLQPDMSATVVAAWVRFPSLAVERLEQSYERLDERRYRYRAGDFRAELEVDGDGLVTSYGRNWRAVAAGGWS